MPSSCAVCNKAFVHGDRKSKYNDFEYHYDCFRCSTCRRPIEQAFYNLGNNEYRCTDCQNNLQVNICCTRCTRPITESSYIEYKQEPIHATCFQCHSCSEPLGNMLYVEHEDEPYCVSCHMEQFAKACAVCERTFPPGLSTRQCGDQYFHIECFRCFHCGKIIISKSYLINHDGQRLCDSCG